MGNQLFRQKSLDRISSPEELHDYMRVTSPRLWMILGAILVLLAGFIAYASTTTMENTMHVKVKLENYEGTNEEDGDWRITSVTGSWPASQKDLIAPGMQLRLLNETGKVSLIISDAEDENLMVLYEMDNKAIYMPEGEYDAELVTESRTPISFLWN